MNRRTLLPALVAAGTLTLAGCGQGSGETGDSGSAGGSDASPSAAPSSTAGSPAPSNSGVVPPSMNPSATGQVLAITITGSKVSPENKRVEVDQGKPLTLVIKSDRAGELHVHSSPEQHIDFEAGVTTKELTFDVPGVIEVEEHKTDSLIAQLEVR